MPLQRFSRAIGIVLVASAFSACGGSSPPSSPSPAIGNVAVVAISVLSTTVEPFTTPAPGFLYRITYVVRESGGLTGATLMTQHFVLSTGVNADGNFGSTPHVAAGGTINVQSTLSVISGVPPAPHLTFTVGYTDDAGRTGSITVEADVTAIS